MSIQRKLDATSLRNYKPKKKKKKENKKEASRARITLDLLLQYPLVQFKLQSADV